MIMVKEINTPKSITEEIFDEFLFLINDSKEFDSETIEKLVQLLKNGDFKKSDQLLKAIKLSPENIK